MSSNKIPPHRQKRRIGLIALAPVIAAMTVAPSLIHAAVAPPITATAKYDATVGKVVVDGKTTTAIGAGSRVSVYDASSHIVLYTANTNTSNMFSMQLLSATTIPCLVRVEVTNAKDNSQSQLLLPVAGADKSCTTTAAVPACAIVKPTMDTEITAGSSVSFDSSKVKGDYLWTVSDGSDDVKQSSFNHQFTSAGKYRVILKVTDGANQCMDDLFVSVIPPAGTNPNGKVKEQTAPSVAESMYKVNGTKVANDAGAYVVLPFEETGMQGGSQIHLPYNVMIPYNSLNAQVLQKVEHKPVFIESNSVDVVYSAASNPKDPAGKNSINSTSQNLFAKNQVGANYDPKASTFDPVAGKPLKNVFIAGQDYRQA